MLIFYVRLRNYFDEKCSVKDGTTSESCEPHCDQSKTYHCEDRSPISETSSKQRQIKLRARQIAKMS